MDLSKLTKPVSRPGDFKKPKQSRNNGLGCLKNDEVYMGSDGVMYRMTFGLVEEYSPSEGWVKIRNTFEAYLEVEFREMRT